MIQNFKRIAFIVYYSNITTECKRKSFSFTINNSNHSFMHSIVQAKKEQARKQREAQLSSYAMKA